MVRRVVGVQCTSVGPVETLRIGFQVDDKVRSRPKGQARLAPSAVKRAPYMELVGIWLAAEELAVFVTGGVPAGLFREERVVTPLSVWWLPRRGVVR